LKQKARRGELFMTVAVGYAKVRHDRIEKEKTNGKAERFIRTALREWAYARV
jgi:hypothetical protein